MKCNNVSRLLLVAVMHNIHSNTIIYKMLMELVYIKQLCIYILCILYCIIILTVLVLCCYELDVPLLLTST